ncbi:MAG: metallophosphoesterase [Ignavibacteria bacterium]|nr:metallophosphoesterase [Ignavibacteria bacterium]
MNRRKFLKYSLFGIAGASVAGGVYIWQIEPFHLEFVNVKMPVKNLPDELVGKTLMQISDIHIGKRFDYNYILESFRRAKQFNPDFVVYTGDYLTLHKGKVLYNELDEVFNESVRGKFGTIAILGNHDYGEDWADQKVADEVTDLITRKGITLLKNDRTEIEGLNFTGLDDYWGLNFKPVEILEGIEKSKANIVLCHNPDVCDLDVWNGYNSWILSGHTHGGQCRPPFLDPPVLPVKNKNYSSGKIDISDGRTLYINRALGHMIQVRFNVRPEITLFTLEKV